MQKGFSFLGLLLVILVLATLYLIALPAPKPDYLRM